MRDDRENPNRPRHRELLLSCCANGEHRIPCINCGNYFTPEHTGQDACSTYCVMWLRGLEVVWLGERQ